MESLRLSDIYEMQTCPFCTYVPSFFLHAYPYHTGINTFGICVSSISLPALTALVHYLHAALNRIMIITTLAPSSFHQIMSSEPTSCFCSLSRKDVSYRVSRKVDMVDKKQLAYLKPRKSSSSPQGYNDHSYTPRISHVDAGHYFFPCSEGVP